MADASGNPLHGERLSIFSWCLYDWANSVFNTVIGTFIFSVYFARGVYGDETGGSVLWSSTMAYAGLAVAVASPVVGAVADRGGRRKPWLAAFMLVTVVGSGLLWFAEPDAAFVTYVLLVVAIATIAFELANVFYNAMLGTTAPPAYLGRVSGWGWGLGYLGGLACLLVALFGLIDTDTPMFGLARDQSEHIRATGPLVAAWFLVFALPLLLFTRDEPSSGLSVGEAVRAGLADLARTVRQLKYYGNIVRFLIASAIYRDGLVTLFAVGGLYASGTLQMDMTEVLQFAIAMNVTSGLGAAGFAFADDRVGSKQTIVMALGGLILFGVPLLLVTSSTWFLALAMTLGLFVGPVQAASRSLMARLSPRHMETEMFGLYAFTGKSVAFLGPLAFAVLTDAFASQRAGMASVVVFLLVGGWVLLGVKEERAERAG